MVAVYMLWPPPLPGNSFTSTTAIAATGDKLACLGQFWHPDAASGKSITRVGLRWGAITKAGGSALTISLQDVDLANTTAPMRPDETQDETVAVANADYTANTWMRSNALSANRAISNGDWLAVVIEYDGSGRLGVDSISASYVSNQDAPFTAGWVRKASGVWASIASAPVAIALECTDSTFGYLQPNGITPSSVTQRSYASNSTPDERGISFTAAQTLTVDGFGSHGGPNALTGDFDLVIYENGTAIHTQSIDASGTRTAGTFPSFWSLSARVVLTAGNLYYVTMRPSTTNALSQYEHAYNSASLVLANGWGSGAGIISRTDAGSWSAVTDTSLYPMRFHVCDIAASGSSGIPIARGMHGGMR